MLSHTLTAIISKFVTQKHLSVNQTTLITACFYFYLATLSIAMRKIQRLWCVSECECGALVECECGALVECDCGALVECECGVRWNVCGAVVECECGALVECEWSTVECVCGAVVECECGALVECERGASVE